MQKMPQKIRFSFQLYNNEPHFGRGMVTLLSLIDKGYSLRGASMEIGMAYSKAWHLLTAAEKDLGYSLIIRKKGGADRKGATLTYEGKKLLEFYLSFEKKAQKTLEKLYKELSA